MDVDILEWNLACELKACHDHSGNPEEDDVVCCNQSAGRIIFLKVVGLFRPSQCGERPQPGTEPGVQHILVLPQVVVSALRALVRSLTGYNHLAALVAVPYRDSVTPPELTGNTPVTDVLKPVGICVLPLLRMEYNLPFLPCIQGLLCQRAHLYEPLVGKERLHHSLAAVAMTYRVNQLLLSLEKTLVLKVLVDQLSGGCTGHTPVFLRAVAVKGAVWIKNIDNLKVVPLAYFPVVRVVGRGDLNHTGSEFPVYICVGYDGDNPVCQRQLELLSYNCLVPLIIRMDCNCSIA